MQNVIKSGRVVASGNSIRFITYYDDFPFRALTNLWSGLGGAADPVYVVQTNAEVIERCVLMTTDPGDLVLDPFGGSNSTGAMAEELERKWIAIEPDREYVAGSMGRFPQFAGVSPSQQSQDDLLQGVLFTEP